MLFYGKLGRLFCIFFRSYMNKVLPLAVKNEDLFSATEAEVVIAEHVDWLTDLAAAGRACGLGKVHN